MTPEDLVLGKLLVKRGLVTQQQVDECIKAQAERSEDADKAKPRPLGVLLVAREYMTDRQLLELMEEVRKLAPYATVPAKKEPAKIGEILLQAEVLIQTQIDEALAEQERSVQEGRRRRLGEILVEKGYAKADDILSALKKQGKTVLSCTGCGMYFNVQEYKPWEDFHCRKCGALLEPSTGNLRVDETGVRIRTVTEGEIPDEVRDLTRRPMIQFGKYIIVKEVLKGPFGALMRAWQKDTKKYVGIVFLESDDKAAESQTFINVQRALAEYGAESTTLLEVGTYEGRRFMSVSFD